MKRVVFLGRGGAGKSTAAVRLGHVTGLPVVELDGYFWSRDLVPLSNDAWSALQRQLAGSERWIMDGDLGPHDVLRPRLERADTVVVLDFSFARCAWRAARRSREGPDFWWWLMAWRYRSRPVVLAAVRDCAARADVHVLRNPSELRGWMAKLSAATD